MIVGQDNWRYFKMNEEQVFEFVEWTSIEPWRMLPYNHPENWRKICNDADDPYFGKKYTTKELWEAFKKEKGYE